MYDDKKTFEYEGRKFWMKVEYDDTMGPPWKEHDGHGVVSEWTDRPKSPGELILATDRQRHLFYDVPATMQIAKRDGWGLSDEKRADLFAKLGREPSKNEIAKAAVEKDYEWLRDWCRDEWHWVGVIVGEFCGECGHEKNPHSLWGIESNAGNYLDDVARELADTIIYEQKEKASA